MGDNQYGYYQLTKATLYKHLGDFVYNHLTPFETDAGTTGFIDFLGNKYVKKR